MPESFPLIKLKLKKNLKWVEKPADSACWAGATSGCVAPQGQLTSVAAFCSVAQRF